MLRMSSWAITVLPVTAPPKSPIFEPLANVQIRSTTLIPVSRISTLACCSEIGGAGRWIGHVVPPSGVGSSSIELPITLNIRPRVSTPTGTDMEAPVACTGSPRRMPSVASMAMHRTTLSPMSDETSRTIFRPSTVTSRASNSSGWSPGPNSTSTTAPMTWLIRPSRGALLFGASCACAASAFSVFGAFALDFAIRAPPSSRARGLGAAHDLHQLGGDSSLADLRSEEHTSELQSPCNLVCRLLLEKKKKIHHYIRPSAYRKLHSAPAFKVAFIPRPAFPPCSLRPCPWVALRLAFHATYALTSPICC